jgi:hypothetical protein
MCTPVIDGGYGMMGGFGYSNGDCPYKYVNIIGPPGKVSMNSWVQIKVLMGVFSSVHDTLQNKYGGVVVLGKHTDVGNNVNIKRRNS